MHSAIGDRANQLLSHLPKAATSRSLLSQPAVLLLLLTPVSALLLK